MAPSQSAIDPALAQELEPHLRRHPAPDGQVVHTVDQAGLEALAAARGISLRQAMITCLEGGLWPERFRPNRGALTRADQARLLAGSAVVIGAGGLGGAALTCLVRLGVGRITVCDPDRFEESNLNRQALARGDRLGRPKAECAAEEAAALNPAVEVRAVVAQAGADNLPRLLAGTEVVLDCLDNLPARYELEAAAREAGVTYVHAAVAGFEGFVMTVAPGDPGLAGLYGPEPTAKEASAETRMGVPTPTPAVVGTLQAWEAARVLLGRPALSGGRVLHLDLELPATEVFTLA